LSDAVIISGEERTSEERAPTTSARETRPVAVFDVLARGSLHGLWFVVIPGLLAGLVSRYLVPTQAAARGTWAEWLARFGDDHEVLVFIGLFLLFSSLIRYWHAWLPAGRYLAPAPAEHVERASGRRSNARFIAIVVVAAAPAVILRGYLLGSYRVLSASMLPTLEPNDLLAGSLASYKGGRMPERGDIIVFKKPEGLEGPDRLIKRVIGLPGDRVSMNGGHVLLNGVQLQSCDAGLYLYPVTDGAVRGRLSVEFLEDRAFLTVFSPMSESWDGTYEVKPGEVFVLGDNRNNSTDSRFWNHGRGAGLPIADIEARAKWRLFGAHRNDRLDFASFLRPLELDVRLEGMDVRSLRESIETCLKARPAQSSAAEVHAH
jgi:signal peptidase I